GLRTAVERAAGVPQIGDTALAEALVGEDPQRLGHDAQLGLLEHQPLGLGDVPLHLRAAAVDPRGLAPHHAAAVEIAEHQLAHAGHGPAAAEARGGDTVGVQALGDAGEAAAGDDL